jgi:hypothetical protein
MMFGGYGNLLAALTVSARERERKDFGPIHNPIWI